jgi:hypothetical protein
LDPHHKKYVLWSVPVVALVFLLMMLLAVFHRDEKLSKLIVQMDSQKTAVVTEQINGMRIAPPFMKIEKAEARFAFVVTDTAMLPVFPKGSLVFIGRNRMLKDGRYGLFYTEKQYIIYGK